MNTFGKNFRVSVFGESHGPCVAAIIDGVPAGLELLESDFKTDIDRRRSYRPGSTARVEEDKPQFPSGLYNDHTTGAPLTILFENKNVRDEDYAAFETIPRPGHSDLSARRKFDGWNDSRGGGQFSGRLTLPIVAAGVVAKKVLAKLSDFSGNPLQIKASLVELGGLTIAAQYRSESWSPDWDVALERAVEEGDSLGGVVECVANVPAGMGEPFWDSMESLVSHAVFSIPGVRGIEFGDGFRSAAMKGSEHNDPFGPDGLPAKNGSGGVNGGITNGAPLTFRVAFKPTSSISKSQATLNVATGKMVELQVSGRHDVCFAVRTPVVVEAMTAIVLTDLAKNIL